MRKKGILGFSILELMVGLAIGMLTLSVASTFLVSTYKWYKIEVDKNKAMANILLAAYNIRVTLLQSINMVVVPFADLGGPQTIPEANLPATGGAGAILKLYDSGCEPVTPALGQTCAAAGGTLEAQDGSFDPIAIFNRESGTTVSKMYRTGIFFRKPNRLEMSRELRSGALYFDMGVDGGPIQAGPEDPFFDGLVQVKVHSDWINDLDNEIVVGSGVVRENVTRTTITIVGRYFLGTGGSSGWLYDPTEFGLTGVGGHKDVHLEVDIGFRNNVLRKTVLGNWIDPNDPINGGVPTAERLLGRLYFFKFIPPTKPF